MIKPQKEKQKEEEINKEELQNHQKARIKMAVSTYLSIVTLNANGLNVTIKRHRMASCITKQEPTICCLKETHFRVKDTHRLKGEAMENDITCKWK